MDPHDPPKSKLAMKKRLMRDEMAYSAIPESQTQKKLSGRQPSDLIQAELGHPLLNCQNFKPALDEFLKNGPSSDVEKVKNLAAEIAAMNSQIDPMRLSTELDSTLGIGNSRNFGRMGSGRMGSGDGMGFSISSFSSFVDIGELDSKTGTTVGGNSAMWRQSVDDLMPSQDAPEKYHKEYKCYESNDKKRLTSKDWTIDYSMNSTTFAPTNEASTELTNNVVTYVQLNDLDGQHPRFNNNSGGNNNNNNGLARPQRITDDKRQMSVEINTASIGIDPEGRLGSYELIKTQLKMEPALEDALQPLPLPPEGYKVENLEPSEAYMPQNNNMGGFNINQFQEHFGGGMGNNNNNGNNLARPQIISDPQTSIGTQIRNLNLVVPPRSQVKLSSETGVVEAHEIMDGDVLLERGGKGNHHKGSRYYRRLINERRRSYQDLPDSARAEKMAISLSVVMSVKATGARFIHKKKGQYVVMSDREARNKISQALREKKERVMLDD